MDARRPARRVMRSCGLRSAARRPRRAGGRRARAAAAGRSRRRRANQPGSGSMPRAAVSLCEPPQHVEILALDHRPGVVALEEARGRCGRAARAAVRSTRARRAPRRTPRSSRSTGPRGCGCTDPSARRTGRWRAPGCPSAHASSATIDRLSKYDGMISRSAAASASNLSWSDRKPRCRMRGCFGTGMTALADQHQVEAARKRARRSAGRSRTARRSPCSRRCGRRRCANGRRTSILPPEPLGIGARRHLGADADDDARARRRCPTPPGSSRALRASCT